MSARIDALRRILDNRRSLTGTVVKVNEQGYYVATNKGTKVCRNLTATQFRAGDSVRTIEEAIVGGVIDEKRLPVFRV